MSEVAPVFKPNGPCNCGCGKEGTFRAKPWRDGTLCVTRCDCRRCLGRRVRAKGDSKARKARKALGIPGANSRHEEVWGGPVRVEVKAGAQVKPAITAFLRCEAQSELSRAIGDHRPFMAVAMPDGSNDGVVMMRLSVWQERIQPLLTD